MNTTTHRPARSEIDGSHARERYLLALNWTFAAFNSIRLLTYLPNVWAIVRSGDSSQHSLVTWLAWVGANASMAAWLYENNGQRCNKAVVLSAGNALMCLATCCVIGAFR